MTGDTAKLLGDFTRVGWESDIAADAVSFTACRFLGVGRFETHPCATADDALAIIKASNAPARKWMIYAINAAGRETLIWSGGQPVKPGA